MTKSNVKIARFHIIGCLRYLCLLVISLLGLWYFHGYLFLLLTLALLCVLPVSAITAYLGITGLNLQLRPAYQQITYGRTNTYILQISNPLYVPLFHLKVFLSEENLFLKEQRVFQKRIYKKKLYLKKHQKPLCKKVLTMDTKQRSLLLFPRENIALRHTVLNKHCGTIKVTVEQLQLTDYLGIFSLKVHPNLSKVSTYVPKNGGDASLNEIQIARISELQKEVQQKGFDDPELLQIREYIPGDKLSHIHWKLSGKCEQLMVKEFEKEEGGRLFLAVELFYTPENDIINEVLDTAFQVAAHFLSLHYRITLGWWSTVYNSFQQHEIINSDDLEAGFTELLLEQTYQEADILEQHLGNNSQYIKIG